MSNLRIYKWIQTRTHKFLGVLGLQQLITTPTLLKRDRIHTKLNMLPLQSKILDVVDIVLLFITLQATQSSNIKKLCT